MYTYIYIFTYIYIYTYFGKERKYVYILRRQRKGIVCRCRGALSDGPRGARASEARAFAHLGQPDQRQEGEGRQVSRRPRRGSSSRGGRCHACRQLHWHPRRVARRPARATPVRVEDGTLRKTEEGRLQLASGGRAEKLRPGNPPCRVALAGVGRARLGAAAPRRPEVLST